MVSQRATTAAWIVDGLIRLAPLRQGCSRADAADTVWVLMDPAVFLRLTRTRGWSVERYRQWVAGAISRLLVSDPKPSPGSGP